MVMSTDNPIDDASVPATPESAIRAPDFHKVGQGFGDGFASSNWIDSLIDRITKAIAGLASALLTWFLKRFTSILGWFGQILVTTRDNLDENMAKLASEGLSDLFGQDLEAAAFAQIGDHASRKQIAEVLGSQVLRGIVGDLARPPAGGVSPSDTTAKAFLTRMAELTVEGWFESIVTGLVSEHPFEKIGDLKEQVGRTFSFGRISHRVLAPAIDAAVVAPFKWKVEKDYRPHLLSEGTAVEMFLRKNLTREQLNEELARQGYADFRIDALIAERQKSFDVAQAEFFRWRGWWSQADAQQYLEKRGYTTADATLALEYESERRLMAIREKTLTTTVEAYVNRFVEIDELTKALDYAIHDDDTKHEILTAASARRELNRSHVNEAKAETAVIDGFWTLQQYTDHLHRLGYNDDDTLTMQLLVQEKIKETSDKTAARNAAAQARAAAKQAQLDKAKLRLSQLDQARSHRALSLAQVHRAYVQGRLTIGQLQDFLVKEGQAPDDIQTLITLAQAERADYQAAQAKKIHAEEKLAVTQLSVSQLEHLVKTGALTLADYETILAKEGVSDSDLGLLAKAAQVDLDAATAAKAHRDAVAAKLAEKGLSLAQFELAVRQGLRTMADFQKWLADNHYTAADQASLIGLLQDRIAADKVAEAKKVATAAKLAHKAISIAELERAVREGLRPMSDFQQALLGSGVDVKDAQTLAGLLQRKIDDDAAAAKRKAAAAIKASTRGIKLADIERAARLGIVSAGYYVQALARAGVPAEDQAVMSGLLQADIAKVQEAKAKQAQAAAKLQNKPVSLAVLQHAVRFGLKSIEDYKFALKGEGFDKAAVDLMAGLLQDEIEQAKVASDRKAALDAKRSTREIARADFEKAVSDGIKTPDEYKAFLVEQGYDEEDQGILYDLLAKKLGLA